MNAHSKKPTTSKSHVSLSRSDTPPLRRLRHSVSLSQDVEAAILRCLPDEYDEIETMIFKLAREWRTLCSDDGCSIGVREFVKLWFDAAGNDIDESFDVVWLCFLDSCERVRIPKGFSPAELALERAKSSAPPPVALNYSDRRIQLLIAICRELQVVSEPSPFFLSCRMAGDLIGVSKDLANSLLNGLARDGVLEMIAKGSISARGKLATRWRFLG